MYPGSVSLFLLFFCRAEPYRTTERGRAASEHASRTPLTQGVSAVVAVRVSGQGGLQHTGQLVGDDPVDVPEGYVLDVEQLSADAVHGVVLVHQDGVRQPVEVRQRQHQVVVLHDDLEEGGGGIYLDRTRSHYVFFTLNYKNERRIYMQ